MDKLLTALQAFYVMQFFLEDYFNNTSSDSIGALLSGMQFFEDYQTADPALWEDWCKIFGNHPNTIMQAFQSMNVFLNIYFQQSNSIKVKNMLNDMSLVIKDKPAKEHVWQKWIASISQVFD